MTWEELLEKLSKAGVSWNGIGTDVMGYIVIHTNYRVFREGQSDERLIEVDE